MVQEIKTKVICTIGKVEMKVFKDFFWSNLVSFRSQDSIERNVATISKSFDSRFGGCLCWEFIGGGGDECDEIEFFSWQPWSKSIYLILHESFILIQLIKIFNF